MASPAHSMDPRSVNYLTVGHAYSDKYTYPTNYLPVGRAVIENDGCLTRLIFKLLYPLSHSKKEQARLKREEAHCKEYWMDKTPFTTVYIGHAGVKSLFHPPVRYTCLAFSDLNKKYTVQYSVIESYQEKEGARYNLCYLAGMLATASSTTASLHPYFASYHMRHEKASELPGLRVISWSVNDIFTEDDQHYLPSFQEAGKITYYVHCYLERQYGKVSWQGHSLGGAYVAEALPHFTKATEGNHKPPAICLDRTFTSLEDASYNDLGRVLYKPVSSVASYLGIKCDVVASVVLFCKDNEKQKTSKLMLISTIEDHRFHGRPNLCNNKTLKSLATQGHLTLLGFNPPIQILTHEDSNHSEPVNHLLKKHCEIEIGPDSLEEGVNFADKFLDLIFEIKESKSR